MMEVKRNGRRKRVEGGGGGGIRDGGEGIIECRGRCSE